MFADSGANKDTLGMLFYRFPQLSWLIHLYNQPVIDYRHDITLLFFA